MAFTRGRHGKLGMGGVGEGGGREKEEASSVSSSTFDS